MSEDKWITEKAEQEDGADVSAGESNPKSSREYMWEFTKELATSIASVNQILAEFYNDDYKIDKEMIDVLTEKNNKSFSKILNWCLETQLRNEYFLTALEEIDRIALTAMKQGYCHSIAWEQVRNKVWNSYSQPECGPIHMPIDELIEKMESDKI
jgi:cobalamin biosynthesis Mg chelatase CobN